MLLLFARLISIISNPIVFAFPSAFVLVYKTTNNAYSAFVWGFSSFLVTGILALFVFYGVHKKFFSDFDISERVQRKPLFIFGALVVLIYGLLILLLKGPRVLLVALTGVALGIFCDSIINSRIKASIHVATFSAFAMGMSLLYGGYFNFLPVLIPLVAWARIMVKRHSLQETIIGALLGISLITVMYLLVRLLIQ